MWFRLAACGLSVITCTGCTALAQDWDVAATSQPGKEVSFEVTEGTWMSLDVSPDGRTIVFDLLGDIYRMPATGGDAVLVHGGPALERTPRFSPDGARIVYLSDRDGADNVWTSRVNGRDARQISRETTSAPMRPSWSADGRAIAAARLFPDAGRLHASELVAYDVAGGDARVIVAAPENGENVHEAVYSPEGTALYYSEKVTPPSASNIYIDANQKHFAIKRLDIESGLATHVVGGWGGAVAPAPSPDGQSLAFVRRVKADTVLFVMDLDSRIERPVFDGLDRDGQADFLGQGEYYPRFDWFPDNRHIAIWAGGKILRVDTQTGESSEIPFRASARHFLTEPTRAGLDLAPETFQARVISRIALAPGSEEMSLVALGRVWQSSGPDAQPVRMDNGAHPQSDPAYSPDGRRLAFVDWRDSIGGRLFVRDTSGRARMLVESSGIVREPLFDPTGRRILYTITPGDGCLGGHRATAGLYMVDVDGGDRRRVAEPGSNAVFSPDGERVFFTTQGHSAEHGANNTTLRSVRLDGSDHRIHLETPDTDTGELKLSPDLRWIAFRRLQHYHVARFDAGAPQQTLTGEMGERIDDVGGYGLTWAADSGSLAWAYGPKIKRRNISEDGVLEAPDRVIEIIAKSDVPSGRVAFSGGRLITMRGQEVIEDGVVVVEGNRIVAVGSAADVSIPADAHIIDTSGKTIMPGLVDMHGHLDTCYYASSGLSPEQQASRFAALAFGVTTNYDPYSSEVPTYALAELTRAGMMTGPRAIDVGLVAYGRNQKFDPAYIPVHGLDDARTLMARKRVLGGSAVKSYRQVMRRQRQQLIAAGREAGVMVDIEGESNFAVSLAAILDGQMNLQHNMPIATLYDDVVQLMSRSTVGHTPTLIVLFGEVMGENLLWQTTRPFDDEKVKTFVQQTTSSYSPLATPAAAPPHVRGMSTIQVAEETWDLGVRAVSRSIRKLDEAGALIASGSHGQVFGLALHWEMWLLAEGGMSPHRILQTATINGARILGIDDQIGTLEAGKLADLIVLDQNPLDDIHNSNSVIYTMANGRLFDSMTMNQVGNHPAERGPFYWEGDPEFVIDTDWNSAWAHDD